MPACLALTSGGARCGKDTDNGSYFWYYDQHQRINRVFHICQEHSNIILGKAIEKETGLERLIDTLFKKIESLKNQKDKSVNFSEQREQILLAKQEGRPKPDFKSMKKINEEINETWRKVKFHKELLQRERNKMCRYCHYSLKDPNDNDDQIGIKYSHADFHSGNGFGRKWCMFHTECGVTWLLGNVVLIEKELKYVKPKLIGQGVLFKE